MEETNQMQSAEIGELAKALAAAQADITGAVKVSENPFFKTRYADLATVMEACRAPLSKHGLAVIQTTEGGTDAVTIVTTLAHASGQWMRGRLSMTPAKKDPQTIGSCITYGRRYTLAAMVGVAPEDDDGNAASGKTEARGQTPDAGPERPKLRTPGNRATPGVDAMLKTGQATRVEDAGKPEKARAVTGAATEEREKKDQPPKPLATLMELSGVTEAGLRKYLDGKGWLPAAAPWSDLPADILDAMLLDENWSVVVQRIKDAGK